MNYNKIGLPRGFIYNLARGATSTNLFFHIFILILISAFSKYAVIVWFYGFLLFSLKEILQRKKAVLIPAFLLYLLPIELIARVNNCSPWIPYEIGKYITFLILIYHLFSIHVRKGNWAWLILILSIPGLITINGDRIIQDFVFNLLGLLNLALGVLVFSNLKIHENQLKQTLQVAIFPILVLLFYLIIFSPEIDTLKYSLESNNDITGKFGANQISSTLGYGFILFIFLLIHRWKFINIWVDLFLTFLIFFWGLLSFSRGGILGALLSIIFIQIFSIKKRFFTNPRTSTSFFFALLLSIGLIFFITNEMTNNALLDRYKGKTLGTKYGIKDNDFNNITSGRWAILLRDLKIWNEHKIMGAGIGHSDNIGFMVYGNNIIAHIEFTRLLAEQGIFGGLIILILIIPPFYYVYKEKIPIRRTWMILTITLSLFTMQHSAMRTMISPVLFGLAFLQIIPIVRFKKEEA